MSYRIHPFWWPPLAALSPALGLILHRRSRAFQAGQKQAERDNATRIAQATPLVLPRIDSFELTVVVEAKAAPGFGSDAAVSYLLNHNGHKVLFDLGVGPDNPIFTDNWRKLGLSFKEVEAIVVSHPHLDHMGGLRAQLRKHVMIPAELAPDHSIPCFTPADCESPFFPVEPITSPRLLPTSFASTGPLARMLFYLGYTYEQSLIADLKGKGLIVVVGCGHPTLKVILSMVRRLSDRPIHAIIGGLHFPVRSSRAPKLGIQVERIFGTGKNWNDPINDEDLNSTLDVLREVTPQRLLISAHDSCDHALRRIQTEVDAEFEILKAGQSYRFSST